ncbi:MAG TPA: flavin reductase family protein [Ktedonobacteraceae bacterium]|jgi:flavin reductase (DIM6/NTAB) family NADH-FMN oxidoreductase RutF|nr:flavin reductase family protein [Ktedonobacteraceae bacterium]
MTIDKDFFRQVMGRFVTGVTVVTTATDEGLSGITVNSFTSVSLDPPLVLICVDLRSHTLPFLRKSGKFAVNILGSDQEALSRCFATTSDERYLHFCHATYTTAATGAPILDGMLAFIDARIVAEYPGGDHAIFVGEVVAMGTNGQTNFANEVDALHSTLPTNHENGSSSGQNTSSKKSKMPLAYYRGQYRHLAKDYQRPSLAAYYDEDFE